MNKNKLKFPFFASLGYLVLLIIISLAFIMSLAFLSLNFYPYSIEDFELLSLALITVFGFSNLYHLFNRFVDSRLAFIQHLRKEAGLPPLMSSDGKEL